MRQKMNLQAEKQSTARSRVNDWVTDHNNIMGNEIVSIFSGIVAVFRLLFSNGIYSA